MKSEKKLLVLSGINLFEGGPLSIYYDCLDELIKKKVQERYRIIAFVHRRKLFEKYEDNVEILELPMSRKNYIFRFYYEYLYFYLFSKNNNVHTWISLHDITPNVVAKNRFTYCHNPSPFMDSSLKTVSKLCYGYKYVLFGCFYSWLYRINIRKATAIIVQQDWMRKKFIEKYKIDKIIVARPKIDIKYPSIDENELNKVKNKSIFIYAAYPRYFKNFEQICEAAQLLNRDDYEVWLSIDGTENSYSKMLRRKYENVKSIKWKGIQERKVIFKWYLLADALIFPSKLETWGLPISEYKQTGKDLIIIDLPYAHESVGSYDKVMFFKKDDSAGLAEKMSSVIDSKETYDDAMMQNVDNPYAEDWESLINLIIE